MTSIKAMVAAAAVTTLAVTAAYGWGAIAIDDGEGIDASEVGYGLITGVASRDAAGQQALAACKEAGNENCLLILSFENCGAYAASVVNYGAAAASTREAAERNALSDCGDKECKIVIADCN